jgi:hypothetical protein
MTSTSRNRVLVIVPKFDQYGRDMYESSKHMIDVIEYDEYVLIKRKPLIRVIYAILSITIHTVKYSAAVSNLKFKSKDFSLLNIYIQEELLKKQNEKYNNIIWIKCDGIEPKVIDTAVTMFSGRHILYLYDPISRYPAIVRNFSKFESIYSFDSKDSREYEIKYLPLFGHVRSDGFKSKLRPVKFCVSFIGEFSWCRLITLIKCAIKLNLPYKFVLVSSWLPNINFMGVTLMSKRMDKNNIYEIYEQSACLLEVINHMQTGKTQRFYDAKDFKLCLVSSERVLKHNRNNYVDISLLDYFQILNKSDQKLEKLRKSLSMYKTQNDSKNNISVNSFFDTILNA